MGRGRHAEPAQSKVLRGNFRPGVHTHGPKVTQGLPPCPTWLGKAARVHWDTIGPALVESGLLASIDGDVFAVHCDTVAKFAEISRKMRSIGKALDRTPQGYLVQSALFTIRSKLHEQLIKTAREFGMTPAGRSGIKDSGQPQLPLGGWDDV